MPAASTRAKRQRRRTQRSIVRLIILTVVLALTFAAGYYTGIHAAEPPTVVVPAPVIKAEATPLPAPTESVVTPTPEPTEEAVRYRDDIVSNGNLLSYELQEVMQDCCEEYEVPYALALAIAEVESHFNPDAVSKTNDYGLMQINKINHAWLQEIGIDPLTHAGNIRAGVYIIGQHLKSYGEPELALMAYNCGATGAKRLWDVGTYQTDYSRKVMAAYKHWTSILED